MVFGRQKPCWAHRVPVFVRPQGPAVWKEQLRFGHCHFPGEGLGMWEAAVAVGCSTPDREGAGWHRCK